MCENSGENVMQWFLLSVAILAEVIATSTLKSTEGFTRLWPSVD
jgi:small multidrug resistance pump